MTSDYILKYLLNSKRRMFSSIVTLNNKSINYDKN